MARKFPLSILFLDDLSLRAVCLLACLSSCGALLLKVYGVLQMHAAIIFVYVPCMLFLAVAGKGRREVGGAIGLGFIAGLCATLAYDLIRIPFLFAGQRVFMTINTYGVWITDSSRSSKLTDIVGWAYHFSNGITFGIMYSLLMPRQPWLWAVVYAVFLETVNLLTPFSSIFAISGAWDAIAILYLGHVAFGSVLGVFVQNWSDSRSLFDKIREKIPVWLTVSAAAVSLAAAALYVLLPDKPGFDQRKLQTGFVVQQNRLYPEFVRIERNASVQIYNSNPTSVIVVNKTGNAAFNIAANDSASFTAVNPGILQLFVETRGRTISSFVIVEPVEEIGS